MKETFRMMDGCKFPPSTVQAADLVGRKTFFCDVNVNLRMCALMVCVWSDLSDYFANKNAALFTVYVQHKYKSLDLCIYFFTLEKVFFVFVQFSTVFHVQG